MEDPGANKILVVPKKDKDGRHPDWIEVAAPETEIPFDLDHLSLFNLDPQVELWREIQLSNMPKVGEGTWKNSMEEHDGEKLRWKQKAYKKSPGGWSAALML